MWVLGKWGKWKFEIQTLTKKIGLLPVTRSYTLAEPERQTALSRTLGGVGGGGGGGGGGIHHHYSSQVLWWLCLQLATM